MKRLKAHAWDAMVRCFGVGDMHLSESIEGAQIGAIFISSESDFYNKAAVFFLRKQRSSSLKKTHHSLILD